MRGYRVTRASFAETLQHIFYFEAALGVEVDAVNHCFDEARMELGMAFATDYRDFHSGFVPWRVTYVHGGDVF